MAHPPVSRHPERPHRVKDETAEALGAALHGLDSVGADSVPEGEVAPERPLASVKRAAKHGKLYWRLRRNHVRKPGMILNLSRRFKLPVALVVAVLDQETGIKQRNIFGCDWGAQGGRPPYCQDRVTNRRVRKMQRSGKPNGVGWWQLTWPDFVKRAMAMRGGARRPHNQGVVGNNVLADDIRSAGSIWGGLRMYNGSDAYANEVTGRFHRWHGRLT